MLRVFVFFICLAFFTTVSAPAAESMKLSLQGALDLAYQQNPKVAAARHQVTAAQGRWTQAGAYPNPEIEVSAPEISQAVGGGSTVGDDSISFGQEIDLTGKVPRRARVAKAEYEEISQRLRQVWTEAAFEVTRAYNNLLLSTQRVGVAREALELTRNLLDQVQLRYSAGEALRNELLRARIEVAKAENGVLQADKQVELDTAALNVLLGREAQASLTLTDELTYEPQDLDQETLLAQALKQRPDLKAADAAIRAQKEQVQLALHSVFDNPTVSAIGTRTRGESGTEQVFGLGVRVPLPLWNQNRGAIREAKAELDRRQVERDALVRQVGLEVIGAITETRLAQRQVTVWKTGVEQANELLRLATQQYREGEINFITYLEHLGTIREAKLVYVEALANYRTQLAFVNQAVAKSLTLQQEEIR